MFSWYVRLLTNRPLVVLAAVAVLAATCAVLAAVLGDLPDFSDPAAGFVTRGTPLHGAHAAWTNLVENTAVGNEPHKLLSAYPLLRQQHEQQTTTPVRRRSTQSSSGRGSRRRSSTRASGGIGSGDRSTTASSPVQEVSAGSSLHDGVRHCEVVPGSRHARLVFESTADAGDRSILNVDAIHSMCAYEAQARALPSYGALWRSSSGSGYGDPGSECGFISLGTYVVLLTNASSCSSIEDGDLDAFVAVIDECAPSYRRHRTSPGCWIGGPDESDGGGASRAAAAGFPTCPAAADVPARCRRPEVFDLFHYFIDRESYAESSYSSSGGGGGRGGGPRPRYAPMFLPLVESERLARLYDDLQQLKPSPPRKLAEDRGSGGDGGASVRVVAAEFGLKQITFQRVMQLDTVWIAVAAALVFVILFAFTGSLFVTCTSAIGMAAAVSVSYCLYRLAFGIDFFPFVNLLTVVVVVAIGADNLLVFAAVWRRVKASKDEHVLDMIVRSALRSAGSSTLVTSLTTAGAFYAGAVSDVLALRCFCLFAGTTVLACYLVSVTWTPACFVVLERWSLSSGGSCCRCRRHSALADAAKPPLQLRSVVARLVAWEGSGGSRRRWCDVLCWSWLLLLTAVGACALVGLLYWPRFRVQPSTDAFPLMPGEHPFEVYEARMRARFDFEAADRSAVPLYFVWGVRPEFDGDFYDLRSTGQLRFDAGFDVASTESQAWLMDSFCRGLRESGLVVGGSSSSSARDPSQASSCFVEDLAVYLEQQTCNSTYATPPCCSSGSDGGGGGSSDGGDDDHVAGDNATQRQPFRAAGGGGFPYERHFFSRCLAVWSTLSNKYRLSKAYEPGVRFFTGDGSVAAVVLRFWANVSDSSTAAADAEAAAGPSATELQQQQRQEWQVDYYDRLRAWFDERLSEAPASMRGGFVVAGDPALLVDDLRRSVAQSVPRSLLVTACVTAALVFVSTLNPALLLYAALTVTCAASVTLASLVLLGWELGILESVIISLAVGLSMDYSLHYVVAYRMHSDGSGGGCSGAAAAAARGSRRQRATDALMAVGDSICYAALTTFVAGACVLPAGVLAYRRLGTFLTIMAAVSWLYALLYLPPLLYLAGPSGDFLQLHVPLGSLWRCLCRVCHLCLGRGGGGGVDGGGVSRKRRATETRHDKTVYVPSASTSSALLVEAVAASASASPATERGCRVKHHATSSIRSAAQGTGSRSSALLETDEEEQDARQEASELRECSPLRTSSCKSNGTGGGAAVADDCLVTERETTT